MCGITGFISLNQPINHSPNHLNEAINRLRKRGPDAKGIYRDENCEFGQTRLSIIDTSAAGNQPMKDDSERYVLIFNGEIYNYLSLKEDLTKKGILFKTTSDTEVLLQGLILEGKKFIDKINGFFAFCFYDKKEQKFLLARDRFGIKPLLYSKTNAGFIFASELKAILAYEVDKEIDKESLSLFFRHTYIPAPKCILKSCAKLLPGHLIEIVESKVTIEKYYNYYPSKISSDNYETAQKKVKELVYQSIEKRLVADVPLGTFLSGGVDSSIVSAVAKELKPDLNTFSIGFPDEPLFDESKYAQNVADHIGSSHHCFNVTNKQLYQNLEDILDYLDEPMADSSAINVFILSQQTKKNVTVSLSGDGADELFSGYNKHQALFFSLQEKLSNKLIKKLGGSSKYLPSSRNSKVGNLGRQIQKLHSGLNKNTNERYLDWASFMEENNVEKLTGRKITADYVNFTNSEADIFNNFLYYDFNLVLENDMLRKVDLMSMANSLEVRTPFLDHELVDYVFSLPSEYKIDAKDRKKILKSTFKHQLPSEVFNRKKHGFEVPLNKWFNNEMKSFLTDEIFHNNKMVNEGLLKKEGLNNVYQKWMKNSTGNNVYHIWSLIVLDNFLKKYIFN
jgi:asparagine synthase (glutamine-hydrolysing)